MNIVKNIADRYSNYNRLRKYRLFMDNFKPTADTKILDVGPSEEEYHETSNLIEKRYPYPEKIAVLGIDDFKKFRLRYPKIRVETYKGGIFPFKDKEFDICWCNAVVEHVGGVEKQKEFLQEIKRVSRKAFVTTPNRYFFLEVHTKTFLMHYLPKNIFDRILKKTGKSWAAGDYMHLLSLKELRKLLENSGIREYRIIKNRLFWLVVDYVVIF